MYGRIVFYVKNFVNSHNNQEVFNIEEKRICMK